MCMHGAGDCPPSINPSLCACVPPSPNIAPPPRSCTADDATVHRHLAPEELRALAAHALVGAAHSFSQAATADYRQKLGPPQVRAARLGDNLVARLAACRPGGASARQVGAATGVTTGGRPSALCCPAPPHQDVAAAHAELQRILEHGLVVCAERTPPSQFDHKSYLLTVGGWVARLVVWVRVGVPAWPWLLWVATCACCCSGASCNLALALALLCSCKSRTAASGCAPSTSRACLAMRAAGTAPPWSGWPTAWPCC